MTKTARRFLASGVAAAFTQTTVSAPNAETDITAAAHAAAN